MSKTTFRGRHRRAFVLLSGGIDSTTALYRARDEFMRITAVSIDYGQRHKREIISARLLAVAAGADHITLEIGGVLADSHVMLTEPAIKIPKISYDEIKGISPTYVPFRNGTMLSVVAAHVMKYIERARVEAGGIDPNSPELKDLCTIYFGAHAEDAVNWAYPDCTPEFIGAMANAIYIGTYQTVRLVAPFVYSSKASIVTEGVKLEVPYHLTWSCYAGGEFHCGTCPTCRARKRAFRVAGVDDPTTYMEADET